MSFVLVLINPRRTVESETIFASKSMESVLILVASVAESVCCFNKFVFIEERLLLINPLKKLESIFCFARLVAISVVFAAINPGNEAIIVALTPPTLLTVGEAAVPPKSPANCILPLIVVVASGVAALVILEPI